MCRAMWNPIDPATYFLVVVSCRFLRVGSWYAQQFAYKVGTSTAKLDCEILSLPFTTTRSSTERDLVRRRRGRAVAADISLSKN